MALSAANLRVREWGITLTALLTSSIVHGPAMVEIWKHGGAGTGRTLGIGAVSVLAFAYALWATTWTLPTIVQRVTEKLTQARLPQPLMRAVVLLLTPALLVTSLVYGVFGGAVRERGRVRESTSAASPRS